jgi:hypothetical protein
MRRLQGTAACRDKYKAAQLAANTGQDCGNGVGVFLRGWHFAIFFSQHDARLRLGKTFAGL